MLSRNGYRTMLFLFLAICFTVPVIARHFRGKSSHGDGVAPDIVGKNCKKECTDAGACTTLCDDDNAVQVQAQSAEAPLTCSCDLVDEQCTCSKECDEEVVKSTCAELMGDCTCSRSNNAYCECFGYCHTTEDREDACSSTAGCGWTGSFCDVVTKLVFNEETDELEPSFGGDDGGQDEPTEPDDGGQDEPTEPAM